ncbi:MAG: hypothetical protein ABI978_04620 [Chloroflexota bacterium]
MRAGGFEPTLVLNPADDVEFAAYAQALLGSGAASVAELEERLRVVYPLTVVHARALDGERILVWYVYRDGRWVGLRPGEQE